MRNWIVPIWDSIEAEYEVLGLSKYDAVTLVMHPETYSGFRSHAVKVRNPRRRHYIPIVRDSAMMKGDYRFEEVTAGG